MKRLLLIAALCALPSLAEAASVTFTFATKTKTFTISGPNAQRIATWAAAAYPTIANPAHDPACNPDPGPCAPATIPNPEPVLSAIDGLWAGVKANVISWEREQAKKAVPEPTPVE